MADGFTYDDWTEDLLGIFKGELVNHSAMALHRRQVGDTGLKRAAAIAGPTAYFVTKQGTLFPKNKGRPTDAGESRPFVAAVKALPQHVPFDTVIVDAALAETM